MKDNDSIIKEQELKEVTGGSTVVNNKTFYTKEYQAPSCPDCGCKNFRGSGKGKRTCLGCGKIF